MIELFYYYLPIYAIDLLHRIVTSGKKKNSTPDVTTETTLGALFGLLDVRVILTILNGVWMFLGLFTHEWLYFVLLMLDTFILFTLLRDPKYSTQKISVLRSLTKLIIVVGIALSHYQIYLL